MNYPTFLIMQCPFFHDAVNISLFFAIVFGLCKLYRLAFFAILDYNKFQQTLGGFIKMRLPSHRPLASRYGDSKLQTQLVQFGGFVIGILSAALLLCMGVLLYSTSRTAEMLHTNHLHSSALRDFGFSKKEPRKTPI